MQVLARHSSAQLALPCVACPHQDQKAFTLVFISLYMSPKKVNSFGNRGIATNTLLRVDTSLSIQQQKIEGARSGTIGIMLHADRRYPGIRALWLGQTSSLPQQLGLADAAFESNCLSTLFHLKGSPDVNPFSTAALYRNLCRTLFSSVLSPNWDRSPKGYMNLFMTLTIFK